MPKLSRSPEEVAAVREKILNAALDILYHESFRELSMRKIAARTDMTAANIYNYFSGKDEIYLAIQTRGFTHLDQKFHRIGVASIEPLEKIRRMIRAYIEFGISNPDQYEIMFTRNTPKYADYIGTSLEPAARIEKETALKVAGHAEKAVSEISETPDKNPFFLTIQLWTALHGLVSLINSRVLQEVDPDTTGVIALMENELMARFNGNSIDKTEGSYGVGTAS